MGISKCGWQSTDWRKLKESDHLEKEKEFNPFQVC